MLKILGATYILWSLLKGWIGIGWYAAIGYTAYLIWSAQVPWWYLVVVWLAGWGVVLLVRFVEQAALNATLRLAQSEVEQDGRSQ